MDLMDLMDLIDLMDSDGLAEVSAVASSRVHRWTRNRCPSGTWERDCNDCSDRMFPPRGRFQPRLTSSRLATISCCTHVLLSQVE